MGIRRNYLTFDFCCFGKWGKWRKKRTITAKEAKESFLNFIKQLVVNTGFTVSDILDNDFETIVGVINSNDDDSEASLVEEETEVMSLGDFMNKL